MLIATLAAALAATLAHPSAAAPPRMQEAADAALARDRIDVLALFGEHCAKCHGERGDGQGTTELDRPARSFLDGGFSYGNTRGALVRSIRFGIPGTPMPAFPDEVLTAVQREALADLVITLGPPGTVVEPGESVLRVGERPVVVRGLLPSLGEGDARVPRGLLIGFPSGTTFEYRADDVRLRAVRQGEFVDRPDWGDRGGIELRPLGLVALDARTLEAPFTVDGALGARRALRGTDIVGDMVVLRTELLDADDRPFAELREELRIAATTAGPVPVRTLRYTPRSVDDPHARAFAAAAGAPPKGARLEAAFAGLDGTVHHVHRLAAGVFLVSPARLRPESGGPETGLGGERGAGLTFQIVHAPRWSFRLGAELAVQEVDR